MRPQKSKEEYEEYKFEPHLIAQNEELNSKRRTVDDLLQWGTEKRVKLANQRLRKMEGKLYSFQPEIDKKSKEMTKNFSKSNVKVEDRLLTAGANRELKLTELKLKEEKKMFRPDINENSKKLLKKKDEVFKVDNGTLLGVDFYKAVPKTDFDDMALKSKKKKFNTERKDKTKSRKRQALTYADMEMGEAVKMLSASKVKNEEIIPDYISPYNKTMLASGLPLKTIIKRTHKTQMIKKKENAAKKKKIKQTRSSYKIPSNTKNRSSRKRRSKSRKSKSRSKSKSDIIKEKIANQLSKIIKS